jgi:16S rRNA (guanine527-N7)-methyltransferase
MVDHLERHTIMTEDDVRAAAGTIGIALNPDQARAFVHYRDLLVEWNSRFNLTALTDDDSILWLHFVDSLTAVPVVTALHARGEPLALIDVGTGGGFPGLPLKIALPGLRLTLMDGTTKKVQFCEAVISALGLGDARALHGRAEEAAHQVVHRERYDVVTARAVAPMPTLVEYLMPFARVGGACIAMKGGDARAEAAQAERAIATLGGAPARVTDVRLPGRDERRALIVVDKIRPTPKLYPRQAGAPRKAPLIR